MKDRAVTSEQKRAVVERLYAAWLKVPEQRFGQLVFNATDCLIFYTEDEALAELIEDYARRDPNA